MMEVPKYRSPVMPESSSHDSLDMLVKNDIPVPIPREREQRWREVTDHRSKSPTFLTSKLML